MAELSTIRYLPSLKGNGTPVTTIGLEPTKLFSEGFPPFRDTPGQNTTGGDTQTASLHIWRYKGHCVGLLGRQVVAYTERYIGNFLVHTAVT